MALVVQTTVLATQRRNVGRLVMVKSYWYEEREADLYEWIFQHPLESSHIRDNDNNSFKVLPTLFGNLQVRIEKVAG